MTNLRKKKIIIQILGILFPANPFGFKQKVNLKKVDDHNDEDENNNTSIMNTFQRILSDLEKENLKKAR